MGSLAIIALLALPTLYLARLFGMKHMQRALKAHLEMSAEDLAAAKERLATGQLDHAEALANKVLIGARTEAERAAALHMLADVAEVRGDFAREDLLLAQAWDAWPKLTAGVADAERATMAKRAFALAAQGKLAEAEQRLVAQGDVPSTLELRTRAVLHARRAEWGKLHEMLAGVDIDAIADAGPRSKLLLHVLRARAEGNTGGSVYRAAATPEAAADPELRAWVARVAGA